MEIDAIDRIKDYYINNVRIFAKTIHTFSRYPDKSDSSIFIWVRLTYIHLESAFFRSNIYWDLGRLAHLF